jgi:hypothetical protein
MTASPVEQNPWTRPGSQNFNAAPPQPAPQYGQPVYNYQPSPAQLPPQQRFDSPYPQGHEQQSKSRKGLWIGLGGAAATLLATGALVFGAKTSHENSNENSHAGTTNSAGVTPGEGVETQIMDPNMILHNYQLTSTRVEQMDYAGTKLNESMDDDAELVRKELSDAGWGDYNYLNRELVKPAIDNSPQQIWDQITVAYAHVRDLAQKGNMEEAVKEATAVAEGDELSDLIGTLANGGANYNEIGVGHKDGQEPVTTTGSYEGVESNGLGLTEFNVEAAATQEYKSFRAVVRLTKGNDDNSMRWVLVKSINN